MRKRLWFVIEGDNGAGKDALADRLIDDGWFLSSRLPQVVAEKDSARLQYGKDRVTAFLSYNQRCGELASTHSSRSFLVRYWPSTLAAAFADDILEWPDFESWVDRTVRQLPAPALILYLQCGLNTRRDRVQQRGMVPGSVDDVSENRDRRYWNAVRWLSTSPGLGNWNTLDTTELNIEQVHRAVRSLLSKLGAPS